MIKRSFRWTRQPTERLGVNWGHPLARDLVEFGYSLGGAAVHNAVRQDRGGVTGTAAPEITRHGHATTVSGTGNYINLARNLSAPTQVASGWVRTRVNSLSATAVLLASAGAQATNYVGHFMLAGTTGALSVHWGDGSGSGGPDRRSADSATGVVVAGEDASLGFVCRAATDWSLYKNGANLGAPTYSGTAASYAPGTGNGTINYRNAGSVYGDQSASTWAYWSRALTDAEFLELEQAPFAILMPYTRRVWVSATSGVTGTLAVTTAADTLAASGTTTVTGTLAVTTAADTLAASGTTTVTGTLAVAAGNDTLAASGAVGNDVSGTLAVTLAADTLAASGTTTVVGTLAATTGADTLSASGTTTVTGSLAVTTGNDTLVAGDAVTQEAPQTSGGTYYLPAPSPRKKKKPAPIPVEPLHVESGPDPALAQLSQSTRRIEAEIAALMQAQILAELQDEDDAALLLLMAA